MGNSQKQQKLLEFQMQRAAGILAFLQEKADVSNLDDFAFVEHEGRVYWVSVERSAQRAPYSAVTYLVQTLFDERKDLSFFILRNRIYTSAELSEMDRGMIRIIAKRVSSIGQPSIVSNEVKELVRTLELVELSKRPQPLFLGPFQFLNAANQLPINTIAEKWQQEVLARVRSWDFENDQCLGEVQKFLKSLADLNSRGEVLHDFDRPISAVLISEDGELLSFGVNSNSINKSLHAEVVMLQRFYREVGSLLPEGSRIFVSHRPCRMCAGMIHQMLPSHTTPLIPTATYFEEVPGPQNHGAPTDPLLKKGSGVFF